MTDLKLILPSKLFDVIERAGLCTCKQLILLSNYDIKKATNLGFEDIILVKTLLAEHMRPKIVSGSELLQLQGNSKISTGCSGIDRILKGGIRRGSITEIYGESGSGKTQICLQAAACNWPSYTVYICTEDLFPVKRYEDKKRGVPEYNPNIDYGSAIFVEHITESKDLLSCVRVRLAKLLSQNQFSLVVLDSIAAPFRVESTNYIQRAEDMRELAVMLIGLAQEFNLAILCINQVTATFDGKNDMLPSLGLAWSNMVCTRLYLKKTSKIYNLKIKGSVCSMNVRTLSVIFAPDLPNSLASFLITNDGLISV